MNSPTIPTHILKINQSDLQLRDFLEDLPEVVSPTASQGLLTTTSSPRPGRQSRSSWLRRKKDLFQMSSVLGIKLLYRIFYQRGGTLPGTFSECRILEDGFSRSFLIEKDDGTTFMRNSWLLKHQWKSPRNHVARKVPVSDLCSADEAPRVDDGALSSNE